MFKIGDHCRIGRRECPKTADYVRHLYYAWHTCKRIERTAKRWEEVACAVDTVRCAQAIQARTGVTLR